MNKISDTYKWDEIVIKDIEKKIITKYTAMNNNNRSLTFERVMRLALFSILILGIVLLIDYLSDVLLPFVAGLVVAYFLNPLTNIIQQLIKSPILLQNNSKEALLLSKKFDWKKKFR